jgi:uncharacterized protein
VNVEEARGDFQLLRKILSSARTIAVVGLSKSWERPSNFAAKYMQSHGYKIVPVNPGYTKILGEKCYANLRDIPFEIDIVDCFRKVEEIPGILEDALVINAKCIWMQLGIVDLKSAQEAYDQGLEVVVDRCVKIEHARLFGGLNYCGVNTGVISSKRQQSPLQ